MKDRLNYNDLIKSIQKGISELEAVGVKADTIRLSPCAFNTLADGNPANNILKICGLEIRIENFDWPDVDYIIQKRKEEQPGKPIVLSKQHAFTLSLEDLDDIDQIEAQKERKP